MRRVFCTRVGETVSDAQVQMERLPLPEPGVEEVRVRLVAAPINPADLLLLTGRHMVRPEPPFTIGIEGAGYISAVGANVQTLVEGQPVALPFGGTWSEEVLMQARDVVPLPEGLDMEQAAMLSVNPVTAAGLLHGLPPGSWLIQNAANSAVGKLVIRLARQRGIRTVNVVRREGLAEELLRLGADVVLVGEEELTRRVAEATGGAPILRGLDAIAGEAAGRLHALLAEGGTLICYGLLASDEVRFPATKVIFRDVHIRGYSRLRWLKSISASERDGLYAELAALLRQGVISSEVEARYPLERVEEAILHAAREGRRGKVVLHISTP